MITLKRTYHKFYTAGEIQLPDGETIYTLELPWKDNAIGESCIPEGHYVVDKDETGKHRWYRFRDEEVEPRSAIEIHPANKLSHLQGCIAPCLRLVGDSHSPNPVAVDSIKACEKLLGLFGDKSIHLKITEA